MTNHAQRLLREQSGFTLIELLVVMLTLGVLAAIAIPAFGDQVGKANDTGAKATARSAAGAIESCRLDSADGVYADCTANALRAKEPSLPPHPTLKVNNLSDDTYTIVVRSTPGSQRFRIRRNAKGVVRFPCVKKGVGGCPSSGRWGG